LASAQVTLISGYNFGQFLGDGFPSLNGTTFDAVGSIGANYAGTALPPANSSGDAVGNNGLTGNYSNNSGRLYWNGTNGSSSYNFSNGVDIVATVTGPNAVNGQTVGGISMGFAGDGIGLGLTSQIAGNKIAFVQTTTGFLDFNPNDYVNGPNVVSDANLTFAATVTAPVTVSWFLGSSTTPFATSSISGSTMTSYSVDLPAGFYNQSSATVIAQFSGNITIDNVQFNGLTAGSGGGGGGGGTTFWKNGDGVWTTAPTPTNWRDASGATQAAWTTPGVATFRGAAGNVTVDNAGGQVVFTGATFATTGYTIAGGNLSTATAATPIQVGDTTAATATVAATISAPIVGTGGIEKTGAGTLTLSGNSTYTGNTTVSAGALVVNGNNTAATGAVSVASAATLSGTGTLGNATVQNGGILSGQSGSTLTFSSLVLSPSSLVNITLGAPSTTELFKVNGALTLDGTVNVANTTGFGAGLYRLFNYTGNLTDNTLLVGAKPSSIGTAEVQTTVANQVNIVFGASSGGGGNSTGGNSTGGNSTGGNSTGGNSTGGNSTGGGVVVGALPLWTGGNGTWTVAGNSTSWKSVDGTQSGAWQPGGFAIFQTGPGTVTVDNAAGAVLFSGLQFAAGGFTVAGGTLTTNTTRTTLRAGDGTPAGSGIAGTISAAIAGAGSVEKTDLGTIILSGDNSYTGGTIVSGGTLQIGAGGTSGSIAGSVANSGALVFNRSDAVTFAGSISGSGNLTHAGNGTTSLTGNNTFTGGTAISAGTLQIGAGGTTGSLAGNVTNNAALRFNRSDALTFAGAISGTGSVTQAGAGVTTLTGNNTHTGGTTIAAGTLQLGAGGTAGSLAGNVANNATLSFNRSDAVAFAGTISGTGAVVQAGAGTTTLTASNTYTGATNVNAGTLLINGTQSGATGAVLVGGGGTLGGTGATGGSVTVQNGGALQGSAGSVFTMAGLALNAGSQLNLGLGAPSTTALFQVNGNQVAGNVTLDGWYNVGGSGAFAPGSYRLIDYTGTLTNNTLQFGSASVNPGDLAIVTSVPNQVNLTFATTVSDYWTGGNGTWTAAAGNTSWQNHAGAAAGAWQSRTATFGGTAGTVTVDNAGGAVAFTGAQFLTNGYTVAGGNLTTTTAETVLQVGNATAAGATATANVSAVIAGTGGLVKTDLGTLTLSGNNTYTGSTAVNAGTLLVTGNQTAATGLVTVAAGARLGGTGSLASVSISDGGVLLGQSGGTLTMAGLMLSANSRLGVSLGAPAATPTPIFQVNGALTLDGVLDIANPGGFGPGLYRLFNYTGSLADNGLLIGANPISALLPTIQTSVANQINLLVGVAPLPIWAGGGGTWSAAAGGTSWGAADGSYQGAWQPGMAIFQGAGGTVNVDTTAGPVVVTGLQFAGNGYTVAGGALTTNTAGTVLRVGDGTAAGDAMTATLSAPIAGSGGVEKTDLGTLILSGANTYTGGTTVSSGTLQIGAGGTTGSVVGDIANNAAVRFNRSDAFAFAGAIGGTGSVTQAGTGTLTLTGANTYTGGTTVSSGTLQVGAGGTTGSLVGGIANNGTVIFNRSDAVTFAGAIGGNGTVVQAGSGNATFTGVIGGAGSFRQEGSGTTTLTGNNTHTGGTVVAGGTLQIGAGGTTGAIAGNLTNNATVVFNRSDAVTFAGAVAGSGNLVNAGSGNTTFSGVISGAGNLRQAGTGTTILTAANTYTGGTTIAAGTLQVGAGGTTGSLAGAITNNGTLAINRSDAVTISSAIAGNGTVVNAGGGNTTFEGVISGSGALRQAGAGTTILAAAHTYTGGTTIAAGTLQVGAGGTTGGLTGAITNNGTLAINRSDAHTLTSAIAGSGNVVNAGGGATTFAGVISGTGALRQDGAGTTILTAAHTYTGGTTIAAGTLQVGAGGTTGGLVGNITNNGTLAINRSDATTLDGVVSGTGSLRHLGSGTTTLTGANIYTGGTTISAGTLQIGAGGTTGSVTGNVVNHGTLAINRSDSYTLDGVVSGTGGLTQAGAGTTTLTGAHAYTGGTTISAGTLQLGAGGTAGSVTGNIANHATLAINRSDAVALVNAISGSGAVVKLGNGTLTLAGNNTYAGGTTVNAGALEVADNANLGATVGAVTLNGGTLRATAGFTTSRNIVLGAGGGTIDTGANILTAQGVMSGAGNLTKSGLGELRLSGASTHTGTTTIAQGAIFLSGGSLGATAVSAGARLAGNGAVRGNLSNAGQLSPGASAGSISVSGNFTQAATGSFVVELASPTSFDSLSVGGTATLGGTLSVSGLNGYVPQPGQTFRIVDAGSVSGTFATLVSPWAQLSPMLRFEALYGAKDVRLSMTQLPFATVRNITPEQAAVGAAVDTAIARAAVPNLQRALNALPDTERVREALTELSPLRYGRWFEQAVLMAGATMRTAEGRMDQAVREPQGTLWTEVVARASKFGATESRAEADASAAGIMVGGDARLTPDLQLGLIFGYTREQLKLDEAGSTTDVSRYSTTIYGRYDWMPFFLEAVVGGSFGQLESRRAIAIPGYRRMAEAANDNRDGYSSLRVGYSFGRRGLSLTPYAAISYVNWSADAINETGADEAGLRIAARSADSLASRVGVSVSFPRMAERISFTPRLDLAWRHEFRGDSGMMTGSLGGGAFALPAAGLAPATGTSTSLLTGGSRGAGTERKNGLVAGLGFDVTFGSQLTGYFRLSTERPTSSDHVIEARAGAEVRF
jgi:autotransporter-associated beta strand protein